MHYTVKRRVNSRSQSRRSQSSRSQSRRTPTRRKQHFVFIVMAHGAIKPNLIRIDTQNTRYYDFGIEMQVLANDADLSAFSKKTTAEAIKIMKTNRGVTSQELVYKFEKIVDDSVPEAYVFDRDLHMFPFVTDEASVMRYDGNDPHVFSVGVHEVTPDINQNLLFNKLSLYRGLTPECRAGLVKLANELNLELKAHYNKLISMAAITAYLLVPTPKVLDFGLLCFLLYKKFITPYIKSNAFKELTKHSVIPITKERYTVSEIISELRKIPKYKHGVHHIIVDSCFGGLTNAQQIEQVLKIQDNEARMNVDVHESFYDDAKKIYDLSSEHQDIPRDSPIYNLLEMIDHEKTNIETNNPIQKQLPFYKRVMCFFKPSKRCILYQNNVTVEAIIAICNITKLWLEILEHEPNYLDKKHQKYVHAYNAKYMCSQSIDKTQVDNILRAPISAPNRIHYDYDDPSLFLESLTPAQPQQLRRLIEKNIKVCIFFQNRPFDNDMYELLNRILSDFFLKIKIQKDWNEYNILFSHKVTQLTPSEIVRAIEQFGTAENNETLRTLSSPDYVDMDAKTFTENELEVGNITESEFENEYIRAKNINFNTHIGQIFYTIASDFNERPIIYHVPNKGEPDLREEYWLSLLSDPLFIIFSRIVETLARMGKFHYIIQQ